MVELTRDRDDAAVMAEFGDDLGAAVRFLESVWRPRLGGEEDAAWDYREIVTECPRGDDHTHIVLRAANRVEGYAVVQHARPLLSGQDPGASTPYLAYLAIAPWSRIRDGRRVDDSFDRLKPVGPVLLARAIQVSMDLGQGGRLALHSLPRAEGWYKTNLIGVTEFGLTFDGEQHLPYFEADERVATGFLARSGLGVRLGLG